LAGFPLRRDIFRPAVLSVRVRRPLGMVGSIFGALDLFGFDRLIGIREFFHAFPRSILEVGKLLCVGGSAATLGTYLSGIVSGFTGLGFVVIVALCNR